MTLDEAIALSRLSAPPPAPAGEALRFLLDHLRIAETKIARRIYDFACYGLPAPQGSKRFVGTSNSGRGILVESSKRVRPWRECVRASAVVARGANPPLDQPLRVRMVFTVPKPSSAPKRRRTWPMRMPDLSKLARATEDALTDAGIWRDDSRAVEYTRLAKVYPNEDPEALEAPGVRIMIEDIADAE